MTKCITFFTTILTATLLLTSAYAQPPKEDKKCPHSGEKCCGKHHEGKWKDLNLTEDQKTKLMKLKEGHRNEFKERRRAIGDIKQKSKDELLKDKPDRSILTSYSEKIAQSHKSMSEGMINHLLEVKKIMNKEQFEKLLNKKFDKGMCERMCEQKCGHKGKGHMHKEKTEKR